MNIFKRLRTLVTSKIQLEKELINAELQHREEYDELWDQLQYAWANNGKLHNMVDRLQSVMDDEAEKLNVMLQKVPEQMSFMSRDKIEEMEERHRMSNRLHEAEEQAKGAKHDSFVEALAEHDKTLTGSIGV